MAAENTQFTSSTLNLSSKVYADLRLKLILGNLKPGQTLSIRTLAEAYDHGSMPVREALRQLSSEGALVGEAKKAYRVPDLSANEATKLFYVRAALEGASAEIAAKTVRPKASLSRKASKASIVLKSWTPAPLPPRFGFRINGAPKSRAA